MTSGDLNIEDTIREALALHQEGRVGEAAPLYNRVLAIAPDNFNALFLAGTLAEQVGQSETAVGLLTRASQVDPDNALPLPNLARAHTRLGRYDDALKCCARAIDLNPNIPEIYVNMGRAYEAQGRREQAVAVYGKALEINPNNPGCENELGTVLSKLGQSEAATAAFKRAIALKPNYPEPHANLGAVLVQAGIGGEAETFARRAIELHPEYADAWNTLGAALRHQAKYDQAIAAFEKAGSIRPDYAEALCNLGGTYNLINRPDEAVVAYQKALEINAGFAIAHNGIANAFEYLGQLDDAIKHYRRAIDLKEGYGSAYRQLVSIETAASMPDLITAIEQELMLPNLIPDQKVDLSFALGRALEVEKKYDRAFDLFSQANSLKRRMLDYDVETDEILMARIAAAFDDQFFARHRDSGCASETPVLIVGMPRSGTSLVEQILSSHSSVFGAGELNDLTQLVHSAGRQSGGAYPESIASLNDNNLEALGSAYAAILSSYADGEPRVIDKLPNNFLYLGALRAAAPNARVIHCVRDPLDTSVSCYTMWFTFAQEYCYDLKDLGRYYQAYRRLMAHFHNVVPGWILDVRYEDMVENQEAETRRILKYLGLPWEASCLSFHETKRSVQTASAGQVRKPLYASSIARWKRYETHLGPLIEALGPYAFEK